MNSIENCMSSLCCSRKDSRCAFVCIINCSLDYSIKQKSFILSKCDVVYLPILSSHFYFISSFHYYCYYCRCCCCVALYFIFSLVKFAISLWACMHVHKVYLFIYRQIDTASIYSCKCPLFALKQTGDQSDYLIHCIFLWKSNSILSIKVENDDDK